MSAGEMQPWQYNRSLQWLPRLPWWPRSSQLLRGPPRKQSRWPTSPQRRKPPLILLFPKNCLTRKVKGIKCCSTKRYEQLLWKSKKATRSEGEPGETVLLPTSRSSKKEGGPKKSRNLKSPCQNRTTTALSPSHLRWRRKRLEQRKVLHSSDNNHNNQCPLLSFVMNMVQT